MENDPEILEEKEPVEEPAPAKTASSSIAVTLTIVALILWFGFQAFQLMRDRGNLRLVKANQDAAMQESEKIRMQFQALMTKTAELAQQGHAGAKLVVDELQRRGVGVVADEKPMPPPPSKTNTK